VWEAIEENVGGLLEFFDMLVIRDAIPLIDYRDTFDEMEGQFTPIETLIGDRLCQVSIDRSIYNEIKKGGLIDLGYRDLSTQQNPARD
jgi:hypothetical protein